jgi:hypothetical protein
MSRTRTLIVAALAATALVGAGAVIGASATTAGGTGSGNPSTSADSLDAMALDTALGSLSDDPGGTPDGRMGDRMGPRHRFGGGMVDRLLHGEVVLKGKDGKPVTVAVQTGEVTGVTADSVTVKSEDGYSRTWTLNGDTVYRSLRDKASKSDVKVGTTVRLAGPVTNGQATAKIVGIPPAGGMPGKGTAPAPQPSASKASTA